jgi:hypothetical protein
LSRYAEAVQVTPRDDRRELERCPLCHAVTGAEALTTCPACGTSAHLGCVHDLGDGRCPTRGCARAITIAASAKPQRAWSWTRVAVAAGVCVVAGLGMNEWRVTRAFEALQDRYDGSLGGPMVDNLDEGRALAAELRSMPRGLFTDGARVEAMADQLEALIDREQRRREDHRAETERLVREAEQRARVEMMRER